MVIGSAVNVREGQLLNVSSFRFQSSPISQPSEFEIHFFEKGIRYQYGFALTKKRVVHEWLFAYAGLFLDTLQNGKILLVDELEASLHSTLSRFLINLFYDKKINCKKAQLIFSTHDTSLLDNNLFRRDQIWFMERDKNNASKLYPLTNFKPRPTEALEKGYLQGRYGALPFFGELMFED